MSGERAMDSVKTVDRCVHCGFPFKEHSYNGACYGICGQFVAVAAASPAGAEVVAPGLPPIEVDPDMPSREYIPLPGGWEIQTKGKGSSYRLLDRKTGERHTILCGEPSWIQDFLTRMAKEVHAACQAAPPTQSTDAVRRQARPADEWRPIETAPSSGRYLVYQPPHRSGRTVLDARVIPHGMEGAVRETTHWMPLPTPPAGAAALNEGEEP